MTETDESEKPLKSLSGKKEYTVFKSVGALPFEKEDLPAKARQYLKPLKDHSQIFLVINTSEGKPAGVAILDLPNEESDSCEFSYRYVFPDSRRQGFGGRFRIAAYDHARELEYKWVESGINSMVEIDAKGDVSEIVNPNIDGTWISYKSMHKASYNDGTYPIHEVDFIVINSAGKVDFGFRTNVQRVLTEPSLPGTAEDLFKSIQGSVIPVDDSPKELYNAVQESADFIVCKNGKLLTFSEFLEVTPMKIRETI